MITVNATEISKEQILQEEANHQDQANPRLAAGQELVLRELIKQRGAELNIEADSYQALLAAVLDQDVATPSADKASCKRYYDQHPDEFREGDLIEAWHILFQLTPDIDVFKLRGYATEILSELHKKGAGEFANFAQKYSNCPSSSEGGSLGEISRGDMVPEFEKAIFKMPAGSLCRELIETRFGFHIVLIGRKVEGHTIPFESVYEQLAVWLEESSYRRAVHQYLQQLVGAAKITGIPMQGSESPLVQ